MKEARKTDPDRNRVRTLTGKEIELDIEPDYKVRNAIFFLNTINPSLQHCSLAQIALLSPPNF